MSAPATFDRRPPHNIDAERSVLGAMLLNPDAVATAAETLHGDAAQIFYVEAHQHIYAAIMELVYESSPVDMVT